ncbi:ATP-binding protein [bacterium]|nr:ATP-binding protein [bacterium]
MLFKRKIYEKLLEWKRRSKGRTALLIEGARRVGKSTIVEVFGKNEYKSYVIVDFMKPNKKVLSAILDHPDDLSVFFNELSFAYNVVLHERETLIVFDEVQRCPEARQLLKALVGDGRYDYVETGSLISIRMNVKDITIPSEEEAIGMYPMDFEEYLWAIGDKVTFPAIKKAFEERRPMGRSFHETAMHRFREYLLVGGMPQAVDKFIETRNLGEVDMVKRSILRLYHNDIAKYAGKDAAKVRRVFDGIPGQLSKKEKKYSLASLDKEARYRNYEEAFLWLDEAKVANIAYNATDPSVALSLNEDDSTLKVYLLDTGLMISQTLGDRPYTESSIYSEVYSGDLYINEGMIMENYIAQAFSCSERKLFFYSRYDLSSAENRMEIDFLIRRGDKICPVEVKSGNYRSHLSLDKFKKKFKKRIGETFILYTKDVMLKDDIIHLPLYMAMFL